MTTLECGAGVELRRIREGDGSALCELVTQNREHLARWIRWGESIQDEASAAQFVREAQEAAEYCGGESFLIWSENSLAGLAVLDGVDTVNRRGSLSYWLGEEHIGKGIMTRACKRLISYCFEDLNLNRLEISPAENNIKSLGVPQRLGFRREGVTRECEWFNGEFVNHVNFGLLKREWQP